jgi:phosphatidylinositol-3,4,5-trisphosphate 3-phosphatase/dual-specificity protein phosphatase PTEN
MGFPGEGVKAFYRNSFRDVIKYFGKYHQGKVKIYNLCDDDYIDTNKIQIPVIQHFITKYKLNVNNVPCSFFPMTDHNPAPLKMIFYFCLDALVFMSHDPANVIAVHCKAGKGRTGLALACYMIFMEGCDDAGAAVNLFNTRRTVDMKGLKIPS